MLRILILAAAAYTLLATLAGLRETTETLLRLRWWLPGLLVALEAASLACYGELVRSVLAIDGATRPRRTLQRAVLVGTALGKLLPGGTLAALPAGVRILQQTSVDAAVATAASLTSGVIASLLLVVLLPIAAAVALAGGQAGGAALGILGVSVGTAVLAVLAWIGVRNPRLGGRLGALARRLGRHEPRTLRSRIEKLAAGLERAAAALRTAARDGHGMTRAACFAAGYWLFDFAVLAAIALAATRGSPLPGLVLACVVGRLAAAVPITPGGNERTGHAVLLSRPSELALGRRHGRHDLAVLTRRRPAMAGPLGGGGCPGRLGDRRGWRGFGPAAPRAGSRTRAAGVDRRPRRRLLRVRARGR